MSAIDPRESARYAGRLFGYFLAVVILGGGVTVGGVVLLRNTNAFSGGPVDVEAELIVGGVLAGVGLLVLLAGLFAIVLNVIADGVRFGVERLETEADAQPAESRAPVWTPDQYRRPPAWPSAPPRRPAAAEHDRPESGERPHQAPENDKTGDDTWKREVEEKLAEDDQKTRSERSKGMAGTTSSERQEPEERGRSARENAERTHGRAESERMSRDPGARERSDTAVEREPAVDRPVDASDDSETAATEPSDRPDDEPWVGGDEVNDPEGTKPDGRAETRSDDAASDATGGGEPDATDEDDTDSDGPAWLEGSGDSGEEDSR